MKTKEEVISVYIEASKQLEEASLNYITCDTDEEEAWLKKTMVIKAIKKTLQWVLGDERGKDD